MLIKLELNSMTQQFYKLTKKKNGVFKFEKFSCKNLSFRDSLLIVMEVKLFYLSKFSNQTQDMYLVINFVSNIWKLCDSFLLSRRVSTQYNVFFYLF